MTYFVLYSSSSLYYEKNYNVKLNPGEIRFGLSPDSSPSQPQILVTLIDKKVASNLFPRSWRGLRDNQLATKTGISGRGFVHADGFVAGWETKEKALEAVSKVLSGRY